ncbi:uncharacterized protein TNCT_204181 [Trichonephila clavata]|uniref:Uncharacterized protein n=1 Tax=Trichonephila clavata TaxID=2740835 RepID=A0A8X6I0G0_TRICU|nr:uncharacterized protein TNCT_204181 [Trichonephila clavata]
MREQPIQKRGNNLTLPKDIEVEISEKSTTGIRCYSKYSPMKEFFTIFKILQLTGINTDDISNRKYGISLRKMPARNTEHKTFSCRKAYEYFIFTVVCTKIFWNILWIWLLPDKLNELTHCFLVIISLLFYVSIYRRRQVLFRITENIIRIYRKLPHRNIKRKKYLFIISFAFFEMTAMAAGAMLVYAEKNTSKTQTIASKLKFSMNSLSFDVYFCFLLARCIELLFYVITVAVFSLFNLYYCFTCRLVRDINQKLLNKFKTNCFLQDVENLIDMYGDMENFMSYMDEELSFPAFLLVMLNMCGLFWGCYKITYLTSMGNYYFISTVFSTIFHFSLLLLLIISASITNELTTKMRHFVRRLPYLFPTRHEKIKFKLKQNMMQNYLTLWSVYVIDKSLAIASFGTLLTYGFLIGSLRKDT